MDESEGEPSSMGSLVHIRASEAFSKKTLQTEDSSLSIPFPLLSGEFGEFIGRTTDGVIVLTNYRLFVQLKLQFYSIPIGLVESIECKEIFFLYIYSKDAKTYRCTFNNNEQCVEWHKRLASATSSPRRIEDLFAFAFYAWGIEEGLAEYQNNYTNEPSKSMFQEEVERMGFDLLENWRISRVNADYSLCASYPAEILVPAAIEDKVLLKLSIFRSSKRIPAVVWRHKGNGCVIARCSQPEMGWMGWRNSDDEKLIQDIGLACTYNSGTNKCREDEISEDHQQNLQIVSSPKALKILILDARSYAAAFTNRAKGGGYECQEYYPNCEIQFMNLVNIHYIRKSFHVVRAVCASYTEQPNWLSVLENTKWLHYISGLLRASMMAVNAIDREERPVVVHCSDGWDRTSQIVSLAELMLDPYYRTLKGFQVLVDKEWLEFGHKFGDRCGHGMLADDTNERCPVFLQFLDCVHQLLLQFPISFEFNNSFLVKLVEHTYSCLFGTFLCNSSQERKTQQVPKRTFSVWTFLNMHESRYRNFLYVKNDSVLRPAFQVRDLRFWNSLFLPNSETIGDIGSASADVISNGSSSIDTEDSSESSTPKEVANGVEVELEEDVQIQNGTGLVKTKSCSDLSVILIGADCIRKRRLSDSRNLIPGVIANGHLNCTECDLGSEKLLLNDCHNGSLVNGSDNLTTESLETEKELNGSHVTDGDSSVDPDLSGGIKLKAFETSTDTLVGELEAKSKEPSLLNGSVNGSVTLSTSTTELSDSRIGSTTQQSKVVQCSINNNNNNCHYHYELSNGHSNSNGTKCALCSVPSGNGSQCRSRRMMMAIDSGLEALRQMNGSIVSAGTSSVSNGTCFNGMRSPSSSFNSRTPSSGFPATPCDERTGFSSSSSNSSSNTITTAPSTSTINGGPTAAGERRLLLDFDGLSITNDDAQMRLHELIIEHESKVNHLKNLLSMTQLALCQQVCQRCSSQSRMAAAEIMDEVGSQPESVGSCSSEHHSVGHDSFAASDYSWETVDEQDTRPTLWEPDHAVNRCPTCDHEFCLTRRKHHCRCCGRIFCSDCSNQEFPVPQEQLYDPVRVCSKCFGDLRCKQTTNLMDGNSAARYAIKMQAITTAASPYSN